RTLQESARVMLHAKKLPYFFWAEAMNTTCYIHNRVTLRADREQRRKMDPESDEGIFMGYSTNSRAYRVFNSRTKTMMESINVVIDDSAANKETDVEGDVVASDLQLD
ncbi:gag-pol polyprotein, partial [Trifolium medium]|nr:gag-pol polyprotein [Trifolium medium]